MLNPPHLRLLGPELTREAQRGIGFVLHCGVNNGGLDAPERIHPGLKLATATWS